VGIGFHLGIFEGGGLSLAPHGRVSGHSYCREGISGFGLYVTGRGSHFPGMGGSLPFFNNLGARTIPLGRVAIRVCFYLLVGGEGCTPLCFSGGGGGFLSSKSIHLMGRQSVKAN
jgi:hypothetical protein